MPKKGENAMPEPSKSIRQNLVNLLPAWLIHFLWFLLADIPPELLGRYLIIELDALPDGQQIRLFQPKPYVVRAFFLPCPDPVNASVAVRKQSGRIHMQPADEPAPDWCRK